MCAGGSPVMQAAAQYAATSSAAAPQPGVSDAEIYIRRFATSQEAVGAFRRHAADVVRGWGYGDDGLVDTATLVVSELATNAVQAASGGDDPGQIALRLTRTETSMIVELWDGDDALPVLTARPDDDVETGRGLLVVDALSREWGCYQPPDGKGKIVWSVVTLPEAPGAADPDTAQPDTAQPDTAQPDTAPADTVQADTGTATPRRVLHDLRASDGWYRPGPAGR